MIFRRARLRYACKSLSVLYKSGNKNALSHGASLQLRLLRQFARKQFFSHRPGSMLYVSHV